jgi:hypothetical protein
VLSRSGALTRAASTVTRPRDRVWTSGVSLALHLLLCEMTTSAKHPLLGCAIPGRGRARRNRRGIGVVGVDTPRR